MSFKHPIGMLSDYLRDKKDDIMADAKSKAKSVMKTKDKDGNLVYPDAKEDLLTHYFASKTMSGKWGVAMPISLAFSIALTRPLLRSSMYFSSSSSIEVFLFFIHESRPLPH
jgi:hypothetical protein